LGDPIHPKEVFGVSGIFREIAEVTRSTGEAEDAEEDSER
jgi:hypothetical protein